MRRLGLPLALLLLLTACGPEPPAPTAAEPPASAVPGVQVWTDWSQLTPREQEEEVYARWYEAYQGELRLGEDYGTLIPFAGAKLSGAWEDGYLYGLMTMDGRVVVDPVYSEVYATYYYEPSTGENGTFPAYVLVRTSGRTDGEGMPELEYAYMGREGGWCTDFFREELYGASSDRILYWADGQWELRDRTGGVVRRYSAEELSREADQWLEVQWCAGWACLYDYETAMNGELAVLNGETGELERWTKARWEELRSGCYAENGWTVRQEDGTTVLSRDGAEYVLPYQDANGYEPSVSGGLVIFWSEDGRSGPVYRLDGTELAPPGRYEFTGFYWDQLLTAEGSGLWYGMNRDGATVVLDGNGREIFVIGMDVGYTAGPWNGVLGLLEEDAASYFQLSTGNCILRISFHGEGE